MFFYISAIISLELRKSMSINCRIVMKQNTPLSTVIYSTLCILVKYTSIDQKTKWIWNVMQRD